MIDDKLYWLVIFKIIQWKVLTEVVYSVYNILENKSLTFALILTAWNHCVQIVSKRIPSYIKNNRFNHGSIV